MLLLVHGVFGYGLENAALAERCEAVVGHDQVIVEIDPDQFAGPLHGAGELEVLGGRLEFARRVVVDLMCPTSLCGEGATFSLLAGDSR